MRGANPLFVEACRGLAGSGRAQMTYVGYLAVQVLVLFLWWPWSEIHEVLETQAEPRTLMAVVIALGATIALYSIRAGAEEILLPGQHPLREWVVATPVGVGRIVSGYLGGHLLQTLHLLLLSSPLLLAGFVVAGAAWSNLVWGVAAVLFMATFYRLVGAIIYLLVGHHASPTFMALRVVVFASYGIAPFVLPVASHPILSYDLLIEDDAVRLTMGGLPGHVAFVAVYATLSGLFTIVLHLLLSRHRRGASASSERQSRIPSPSEEHPREMTSG